MATLTSFAYTLYRLKSDYRTISLANQGTAINYHFRTHNPCRSKEHVVTRIVIIHFVCHQNEALMKTVKFFNACNDTAAVEARGDGPLKKLIDDMGGWNVTGNMKSLSSMDITQRIGKVSSELFIKPFIDVKVFIDPHDSNKHILQVRFCLSLLFKRWKTLISLEALKQTIIQG